MKKIVPYISASQIGQYYFCPVSYYYCYVKGINKKGMDNIYMIYGSAIHEALAYNFKQKITTRKDLAVQSVTLFFKEVFGVAYRKFIDVNPRQLNETQFREFNMIGELVLEEYMELVAPKIMPLAVEQEFELKLEKYPITIKGFIDLITEDFWVWDYKTVGKSSLRKWSQSAVDNNLQLTLYSAAFRKLFNRQEAGLGIQVLPRMIDPVFKFPKTSRSQTQIHQLLNVATMIEKITEVGIFIPNWENCKQCPLLGKECNQEPINPYL